MKKLYFSIGGSVGGVLLLLACAVLFSQRIPVGHVGVATMFGEVSGHYEAGLHVPVNPFLSFTLFDVRQQTMKEEVNVPSQDQLTTTIDFSFQYRANPEMCETILAETGTLKQAVAVHLTPMARSSAREHGKAVAKAEEFFLDDKQRALQQSVFDSVRDFVAPKGIIVDAVLIRDICLPDFIVEAIETKKVREQKAEEQKAELLRYQTEQGQVVAKAKSENEAATEDADKRQKLADAQAYEIEAINKAIAQNPAYIQLEALKTLQAISKDPAAKIYFLDGSSPTPLPLMHLGKE